MKVGCLGILRFFWFAWDDRSRTYFTDLAETANQHQFEDLHFIVDHQAVLSKLLSGQAQPVNAAKYGASYRANLAHVVWAALGGQEVCPKRVVKTRGVKDDLRQCRRASSHTGANRCRSLGLGKKKWGSACLKKSWLDKMVWNQFLLWIYKIGHIRSIDYIYIYIHWYEDRNTCTYIHHM